jgi:hypothetical protein
LKARTTTRAKKNDPKLVAAARELRDRWLEEVNAGRYVLEERGKYSLFPACDERSRIVRRGEGQGRGVRAAGAAGRESLLPEAHPPCDLPLFPVPRGEGRVRGGRGELLPQLALALLPASLAA